MGSHVALIWGSLCVLVSLGGAQPLESKSALIQAFSRTAWKFDEGDQNVESLRSRGAIGEDGYINVANQFGLSGRRGTNPSLYEPLAGSVHLGECTKC